MQLFRQGDAGADNPMVQQISSMFSKQLGSKFQVDGLKADGIASQLIPMILSRFIKRPMTRMMHQLTSMIYSDR